MNHIFCQLSKLVNHQSIIAFIAVVAFCILAVRQNVKISSEMFAAFVSSIVTFSFVTHATKDSRVIEKLPLVHPEQEEKE